MLPLWTSVYKAGEVAREHYTFWWKCFSFFSLLLDYFLPLPVYVNSLLKLQSITGEMIKTMPYLLLKSYLSIPFKIQICFLFSFCQQFLLCHVFQTPFHNANRPFWKLIAQKIFVWSTELWCTYWWCNDEKHQQGAKVQEARGGKGKYISLKEKCSNVSGKPRLY